MSCSFSRRRRLFTISHGTRGTRFKSHAKLFWDGQILTFFCCLHGLQSLFLPLRCHWLGWWIRKVRIKFRLRFWQEFNFCVFQIYNEYTTVYNSLWMCVVSGLIDLYWRSGLSGTRKSKKCFKTEPPKKFWGKNYTPLPNSCLKNVPPSSWISDIKQQNCSPALANSRLPFYISGFVEWHFFSGGVGYSLVWAI